jgi:hypothetical protein
MQDSWKVPARGWLALSLTLWVGALTTGCGLFGNVQIESVATTAEKPANVAAYVAVTDNGEPVEDLAETNFNVYENEQLIPRSQTRLTILARDPVVAHHVLLLVDMSGADDPTLRQSVARATSSFVQTVRALQRVTVYAFDGRPDLHLIGDFEQEARAPSAPDMSTLAAFTARDASRDLRSAIVEGMKQLDARLMQLKKPVRVGTLVVFARGPDLAGRLAEEQLDAALDNTSHETYAIVLPAEDTSYERAIQRNGVIKAESDQTIPIAFDEMGMKLHAAYDKYYLISYCSPARAGKRRLRLEVEFINLEGEKRSASFEHDFYANGFGPGCDSQQTPRFVPETTENTAPPRAPVETPASDAPEATPTDTPSEPATTESAPQAPAP